MFSQIEQSFRDKQLFLYKYIFISSLSSIILKH